MIENEYEVLEQAYWEFDSRRKGYGKWKGMPQAERDAFKAVVRGILSAIKMSGRDRREMKAGC